MTAGWPAGNASMSRPKNGTPVRPICRRGSGSPLRAIITKTRPVMGPAFAEAG